MFALAVCCEFGEYVCRVRSIPQPDDGEFFELRLKPSIQGVLQVVGIYAHKERYRRKGIPDALLPRMCKILRCRVRSSPTAGEGETQDQWRTPDATAMWNRLVSHGLASYDVSSDLYWMPPQQDVPR